MFTSGLAAASLTLVSTGKFPSAVTPVTIARINTRVRCQSIVSVIDAALWILVRLMFLNLTKYCANQVIGFAGSNTAPVTIVFAPGANG